MNEEAIFIGALEHESQEDRDAFLDQACGDDADLRQRINALLASHQRTDHLLDESPPGVDLNSPEHEQNTAASSMATHPEDDENLPTGRVIGPYRLIEKLGEGGMGVVYMAQQFDPIHRLVAVKVVKPGMDSVRVIARFEAERQALAVMNHPNVAAVYDAGMSDDKRPYFVIRLRNIAMKTNSVFASVWSCLFLYAKPYNMPIKKALFIVTLSQLMF